MSDYLNGDRPVLIAEGHRLVEGVRVMLSQGVPVWHGQLWLGLSKWGIDAQLVEDLLEHAYNEVTEEEAEDGALTTMPRCMSFGEYLRILADVIGLDVVIGDVWDYVHGHVDACDDLGEDYDYAFTWLLNRLGTLLGEFDDHLLLMELEVVS
jgi:hypothetical protein